jgi:flagellar biogenesis protein FliO
MQGNRSSRAVVLVFTVWVLAGHALGAEPAKPNDAARIADRAIESRFGDAKETRRPVPVSPSASPLDQLAASAPPAANLPPVAAAARESLPLGPAHQAAAEPAPSTAKPGLLDHWAVRTVGALAIVIGLILLSKKLLVGISRATGGVASQFGAGGRAPSGVLEILGRYPVTRGHTLVLLRMDRRVLLLGHSSGGFTTLAEVADEEEVASLLLKTRDEEEASMAARFSAMLRGMERDPSIVADAEALHSGPGSPRAILRRAAERPAVAEPRPRAAADAGDELVRRLERLKGVRA